MRNDEKWTWDRQDEAALQETILQLVRIPSVTGSQAEHDVASYLADRLRQLECAAADRTFEVEHFTTKDGQQTGVGALYRGHATRRTVVLIAHTDVVGVSDFGPNGQDAFDIPVWTARLLQGEVPLPAHAKADTMRGRWWFGRGVMDMKTGLAVHLHLFEKACKVGADSNLVFLAVPDEESQSRGMIAAVDLLRHWRQMYDLEYVLCLNGEPSFVPSDATSGAHIYSGTFGKILLGALAVGVPGHVGMPFSGLNAIQMISHLTTTLEAHPDVSEYTEQHKLVPVTCLWQRDLQETYSVQSPHMAAAFFHVPFFRRSPSQVLNLLRQTSDGAMRTLQHQIETAARQVGLLTQGEGHHITVHWLSELLSAEQNVLVSDDIDPLTGTLCAVKDIVNQTQVSHTGRLVLFIAPPVYPPVDASADPMVSACIHRAKRVARERFDIPLEDHTAFPGLCDLSYTGYQLSQDWSGIAREMPGWGSAYSLPLQTMAELSIPVCNLGPYGKDAHQWTERLDVDYATRVLPALSMAVIEQAWSGCRQ